MGLLCAVLATAVLALESVPFETDAFLGGAFKSHTFDYPETGFRSTLVHYMPETPADSAAVSPAPSDSAATDSLATPLTQKGKKAMVLYIHGFNDYFFQWELAKRMDAEGYSFYAVDLHRYGRSYRAGETLGELYDISEYYAELDTSIAAMRALEGDSMPLVLVGHSTGGLIACLYAADRHNGAGISAIVLNSPFLEMNYPWPVRRLAVPLLSAIGKLIPGLGIPRGKNMNYDISLHKAEKGEWDYSRDLKVPGSLSINFGWLHAIHQGHARIQQGLHLDSPVLVMHSGCSYKEEEWSEEYTRCDGVLNVEHIREFGANLGPSVQLEEIQGGLHDLYLSARPVREKAYQKTFEFLDRKLKN